MQIFGRSLRIEDNFWRRLSPGGRFLCIETNNPQSNQRRLQISLERRGDFSDVN